MGERYRCVWCKADKVADNMTMVFVPNKASMCFDCHDQLSDEMLQAVEDIHCKPVPKVTTKGLRDSINLNKE